MTLYFNVFVSMGWLKALPGTAIQLYSNPCSPLVYNLTWPYARLSCRKTGHNKLQKYQKPIS